MDIWLLTVVAATLAAAILYSLAEGALLHFSSSKLEERLRGKRSAEGVLSTLERAGHLTFIAHVAGTFMRILLVLSLSFLVHWSTPWGFLITLVLSLAAAVIVGLVVPREIARRNAEAVVVLTIPILTATSAVLNLLHRIIASLIGAAGRLLRLRAVHSIEEAVEDDILTAVHEGEREGVIKKEEKEMIVGIISLRDENVADVMTPRTRMFSIPIDTPLPEVVRMVNQAGHSRVPIFDENRDDILGILHGKDLLQYWGREDRNEISLKEIMRPAVFVPETKKISDMLRQFRTDRVHLAIVVDEYGGTAGIITIEDILEEIVGEIRDEFDIEPSEEPTITMTSENSAVVDARLHMMELNEKLHLDLPEDEAFDTVGGFICFLAGRVPTQGDQIVYEGVVFAVLAADDRQIHSLRVTFPLSLND